VTLSKNKKDNQPQRQGGGKEARLVTLARERFDDLSAIEEEMFRQIAVGEVAIFQSIKREKRKIRAECIKWVCTDKAAKEMVTHQGVDIVGTEFEGAIDLQFAEIPFPLKLIGCSHPEVMNFEHAKIRFLGLMGSEVGGIEAEGIHVGGDLFLRDGFKAKGEVRLVGGRIGGGLDCIQGKFNNEKGNALICDGMKVGGSVLLRNGFEAKGEVGLLGARIGGNLECDKGRFYNEERVALNCAGMKVEGSVYLRNGFEAKGWVSLANVEIKGSFQWLQVKSSKKVVLDLRGLRIGTLRDDEKSWPEKGKLLLDGFTYKNITDDSPKEARSRIAWLKLQDDERFRSQPYEQLAKVFERGGYEKDAKKIRDELAKGLNDQRFRPQPYEHLANVLEKGGYDEDAKKIRIELAKGMNRQRRFFRKWFHRLLIGIPIGYGYRPWRAFWIGVAIVLWGWLLFWGGFEHCVMRGTNKEAAGKRFQAFIYSVDMFVPLVDLYEGKYWLPDKIREVKPDAVKVIMKVEPNAVTGIAGTEDMGVPFLFSEGFLWWYLRFHIVAGWVLTTLLAVGLTGLVRQRR